MMAMDSTLLSVRNTMSQVFLNVMSLVLKLNLCLPLLGTFTAPRSGAYVFSFTVASMVEDTGLLYHKVNHT